MEITFKQIGQNIIVNIDKNVKTKKINDKAERDAFIVTVKDIINSKKKDETKQKELEKLFKDANKDRKEKKEEIVDIAKQVQQVKKVEKKEKESSTKVETEKIVEIEKKIEVEKAYDIEGAKKLIHRKIYSFRNRADFMQFKLELIQEIANDKGEF